MEWLHVRHSQPERWALWHAPLAVILERRGPMGERWHLICEALRLDTGTNTPCLADAKRRAIQCIKATLQTHIARDQILLQEFDTLGDS